VKRAAATTQADIRRAIEAARKAGASTVEVRPDGSIIIRVTASSSDFEVTDREITL
jgi:hypothetical protein